MPGVHSEINKPEVYHGEADKAMYCSNCGAKLADGAKFCHECGKAVLTPADNTAEKTTETESDGKKAQTDKASIIVKRLSNTETRSQSCFIYLDNSNNPAMLNNDSEYSFSVLPGTHTVTIKHNGMTIKKEQVFVSAGETNNILFTLEGENKSSYPSTVKQAPLKNETNVNTIRCPQCGGDVSFQTVTESSGLGCGSFIGIVLVALLSCILSYILGIFVFVIGLILVLKGSNETVTYAVCQKCGHRFRR